MSQSIFIVAEDTGQANTNTDPSPEKFQHKKGQIMNIRPLLLLALLAGFQHCGYCATNITLVGANSTYSINSGQVARVVSAHVVTSIGALVVQKGVFQTSYNSSTDPNLRFPIVLAGPATFTMLGNAGFCTIEVSNPDDSFVPSNAVVIPADSGGPVNIILESSADLVNWTAASPGAYGANTTNRFFRVRAQRTP